MRLLGEAILYNIIECVRKLGRRNIAGIFITERMKQTPKKYGDHQLNDIR